MKKTQVLMILAIMLAMGTGVHNVFGFGIAKGAEGRFGDVHDNNNGRIGGKTSKAPRAEERFGGSKTPGALSVTTPKEAPIGQQPVKGWNAFIAFAAMAVVLTLLLGQVNANTNALHAAPALG